MEKIVRKYHTPTGPLYLNERNGRWITASELAEQLQSRNPPTVVNGGSYYAQKPTLPPVKERGGHRVFGIYV